MAYKCNLGVLHLHPISETYQFRPTLTHIDVLNRKNKRSRGGADSDNDSDDGPPPDPDEPTPNSPPKEKKEKKKVGESKEVQVSVRKVTDDKGMSLGGGLTAVRRDMLMAIRAEEDEKWEDYEYHDEEVGASVVLMTVQELTVGQAGESLEAFDSVLSKNEDILECKTDITQMLKSIHGL